MSEETNVLTAPYIPFPTFTTALSNLKAHGPPTKLDRSVFDSFSGAIQGQVLSDHSRGCLVPEDVPAD